MRDKKREMFEQFNYDQKKKLKDKHKKLSSIRNKIWMIIALRMFKGPIYIKLVLKRIEIARELFIDDI